jgi:recombination protein RecR
MSQELPHALSELIEALGNLPGVGPRSAERYAYYLFKSDPHVSSRLSTALQRVHTDVKQCPVTFALINGDQEVSPLYSDTERDKTIVAVVEEPLDIIALERTGQFRGTYHVLGGAMSPIDNVGPEQLHIPELLKRLETDKVREVILATNASVEGESTALYIQHQIQELGLKVDISRLARGIPVGVDLEYADQITLTHALEGRRKL